MDEFNHSHSYSEHDEFAMSAEPALFMNGQLLENVSMQAYSSWRSGGRVKQLYQPADMDDLSQFLRSLPEDESIIWLGLGSNLLVRDGGFDGTVITVTGFLDQMESLATNKVRVEAGVPCPKAARYCANQKLAGAEFLVGIPGTIGGALAMNAGAFGGETWDIVSSVETIDRNGQRYVRKPDEFEIAYRHVRSETQQWFLAAEFTLKTDEAQQATEKMRQWLQKRSETQPMGQASCGSVFRNPPNDYAARLIEDCGLKGMRIGGACVSEKHANFIVNDDNARAADIEALINHVQQQVEKKHGVQLQPEVCVIGEQ